MSFIHACLKLEFDDHSKSLQVIKLNFFNSHFTKIWFTAGGILAGIAFLISGVVELKLEKTYPIYPQPNESQVRIFNSIPCNYSYTSNVGSDVTLSYLQMNKMSFNLEGETSREFIFSPSGPSCSKIMNNFKLQPGQSNSFFITGNAKNPEIKSFNEKIDKTKSGYPSLRVLSNINSTNTLRFINQKEETQNISPLSIEQIEILPSTYKIFADDIKVGLVELLLGGVYTVVISETSTGTFGLETYEITSPNSVHMLWLIPQFVIMTAGEVMFSVTGLEFAYSQAPTMMKSLLQACWLLTVAFGNVIVVIIAELKIFQSQAHEFFLFAVLMFIDMAVFGLLAVKYKYVTNNDKNETDSLEHGIPIDDKKKTFTNNAFQEE